MPAVFIHGVPDTHRVWNLLRVELGRRDTVALDLPGFGQPRPAGFAATKDAYVEWLVDQLASLDGPVDLVGHDWGAILAARLASVLGDRIRSWVVGNGPISADYQWHDMAQMWQTPEVGEAAVAALTADTLAATLPDLGVPPAEAAATGRHVTAEMRQSILDLYRSAVTVGEEWEPGLADIRAPGLVLWGDKDELVWWEVGERMAAKAGAKFHRLPCNHWWQLEMPVQAAAIIEAFWADLDAAN